MTTRHPGRLASAAAVGLIAGRMLHRQRHRLAPIGEQHAAAQQLLVPLPPATVGPLSVAARYLAADTHTGLGGDLYAVQDTPYGIRLLIGDVRGKGPAAAGTVGALLAAFRTAAEQSPTLEELVAALERAVEERGQGLANWIESPEDFTTVVAAEISPDGTTLRLINRGHPAPVLIGPRGVQVLEPSEHQLPLGLALGLERRLGAEPAPAEEHSLPEGATLLLLTDGVTEARDGSGTFYDVHGWLRRNRFTTPGTLLDALCRDLGRHTSGTPGDDVALLALRRPPTARPPRRTPRRASAAPQPPCPTRAALPPGSTTGPRRQAPNPLPRPHDWRACA